MKPPYLEELKTIAPSIVFRVSRSIDRDARWDGTGPDPEEEGYVAYSVDVSAQCIVRGELIEGNAYLGCSYYKPDEPTGDAHGYLPQMLEEAATELPDSEDKTKALAFLKSLMRRLYDEQRTKIALETPTKLP